MRKLDGKVAIITGGGGGLGSEASRRLAAEGARVVVADVDMAAATRVASELGDRGFAYHFDYRDEKSIKGLIDATIARWGRHDLLDNNGTATTAGDGPIETADAAVWDLVYQVTMRGYVLASKYAIPHLRAAGGGLIINMGSDSARSGDLQLSAYGAMKAAVLTLTQYIATQYGKEGIRCVSITPGLILTQTARSYIGEEGIAMMESHHLTPRLGIPADLAALVAFLASDESVFLTGINIPLDGGFLSHLPTTANLRRP